MSIRSLIHDGVREVMEQWKQELAGEGNGLTMEEQRELDQLCEEFGIEKGPMIWIALTDAGPHEECLIECKAAPHVSGTLLKCIMRNHLRVMRIIKSRHPHVPSQDQSSPGA
jgi:hypothetical protein